MRSQEPESWNELSEAAKGRHSWRPLSQGEHH